MAMTESSFSEQAFWDQCATSAQRELLMPNAYDCDNARDRADLARRCALLADAMLAERRCRVLK